MMDSVRVSAIIPRRLYALCRYYSAGIKGGISAIIAQALEQYFQNEAEKEK